MRRWGRGGGFLRETWRWGVGHDELLVFLFSSRVLDVPRALDHPDADDSIG